MSSREAILQRIRERISGGAATPPLERIEVWPDTGRDRESLVERFTTELEAVAGEVVRCRSIDDARTKLAELIDAAGWSTVAAADTPLVRDVLEGLPQECVLYPEAGFESKQLARIPAAVISAECFLADTGSAVVRAQTGEARLLAYLPETSVIIGRTEQLREHMPAAWGEISERLREEQVPGEWVVVSGPSRTADIEKILILGVHGPKRLVVMMVDSS